MQDKITLRDFTFRPVAILLTLAGLIFLPWQTSVPAAAFLEGRHSDLYIPESGKLISMPGATQNKVVDAELLFELSSPELDLDIEQATHRYTELRWMQSSLGFDAKMRSQARIVNSELVTQNQILRDLFKKSENLVIRAPFSGEIVDIAADLNIGDWLSRGSRVATVVDFERLQILAYLAEEELDRIELGMNAKFYPENIEFGVLDVFVNSIDLVGTTEMDTPYLASLFGGNVAVRETDSGTLSLVKSHYRIELSLLDKDIDLDRVVRGTVVIDGRAISFFSRVKRKFVEVFLRETGF